MILTCFQARILAEGSYKELQSSGLDFVKQTFGYSDERAIASDPEPNGQLDDKTIVSGPIADLQVSNGSNPSPVDKIKLSGPLVRPKEETECQSFGNDTKNVYVSYMLASGSTCNIILLVAMYIFTQIPNSGADYWITYWYYLPYTYMYEDCSKTSQSFIFFFKSLFFIYSFNYLGPFQSTLLLLDVCLIPTMFSLLYFNGYQGNKKKFQEAKADEWGRGGTLVPRFVKNSRDVRS